MFEQRVLHFGVLLIAILLIVGCGDARRQPLKGTVTVDGKPLRQGSITFRPQPGTRGPTAGANVVDGRFEIDPKGGTFVGRFRVEINAMRPNRNRKVVNEMTGEVSEGWEQYLPPRYNTQSELEADVRENELNVFEFTLSTKNP